MRQLFFQRACIHRIEAELILQLGDYGFGLRVIARDHVRASVRRSSGLCMLGHMRGLDVIEGARWSSWARL